MFGIPSGYEFGSLIESIKLVSEGKSGLAPDTRRSVAKLTKPVKIQVSSPPPDRTARQPCCWRTNWPWKAI